MENIKQMKEQWNVSLGSVLLWRGALRVSARLVLPDILWLPFSLMLVLFVFIEEVNEVCVRACVDSTSPWTQAFV